MEVLGNVFIPQWGGTYVGVHYTINNKLKKAKHGLMMRMCYKSRIIINPFLNFNSENYSHSSRRGDIYGLGILPKDPQT